MKQRKTRESCTLSLVFTDQTTEWEFPRSVRTFQFFDFLWSTTKRTMRQILIFIFWFVRRSLFLRFTSPRFYSFSLRLLYVFSFMNHGQVNPQIVTPDERFVTKVVGKQPFDRACEAKKINLFDLFIYSPFGPLRIKCKKYITHVYVAFLREYPSLNPVSSLQF